ncbi:MAG: hypothetical protein K1X79_13485 [Oligoflexia bacterium]|nr:hypothetical protein [Oligoflexia bacterium]
MLRKMLTGLLAISCALAAHNASAQVSAFEGCTLKDKKTFKVSGRFIWKPALAHFPVAGLIAPRAYFPIPPVVELFTEQGVKIESGKLKTTGLCAGYYECLFAATFKFKFKGSYYQKKFGKIFVRIKPGKFGKQSVGCRYYPVPKPKNRAEYFG